MSSRFDKRSKVGLGNYFRLKREEKGLSQTDVALFLGVKSAQSVSNIERGHASFSISHLKKIKDLYKISTVELEEVIVHELKNSFCREWKKMKSS